MATPDSMPTLMGPQELYELWERQQWSAHAIDLTRDRLDWHALDPADRRDLLWNLASFNVGEHRVTTDFGPLVGASESASEEAFLCTQQVDEARHAQHFDRFWREVVGDAPDAAFEPSNDALVHLFDDHLLTTGRRLAEDPGNRDAKVEFVVTYHLVIEGVIALSGQDLLTRYCEERGVLPGLLEGLRSVSQDEHRHIAYGVWYLRREAHDPDVVRQVRALVPRLLRVTRRALAPPPGADPAAPVLGRSTAEMNAFAYTGLRRRLKLIGIPLPAVERLAVRA